MAGRGPWARSEGCRVTEPTSAPLRAAQVPAVQHLHLLRAQVGVRVGDRAPSAGSKPAREGTTSQITKPWSSLEGPVDWRGQGTRLVMGSNPRRQRSGDTRARPNPPRRRMGVEHVGPDAAPDPDLEPVLTSLQVRGQLTDRRDVRLETGNVFKRLPVLVAVAARDLDQLGRGEHQAALGAGGPEPVGDMPCGMTTWPPGRRGRPSRIVSTAPLPLWR